MVNLQNHDDREHDRHHSDNDAQTEALRTRPSYAAHWFFRQLDGVRGVTIPETALFDDEGVLEAWLYTRPATSPHQSSIIVRRDYLEMNLLRLEVHFQDVAKEKLKTKTKFKATPIATGPEDKRTTEVEIERVVAIQWADEVRYLTEHGLDALIRVLCAREREMTAFVPQLEVSRLYPGGGRFVLQTHGPHRSERAVVRFRVTRSHWIDNAILRNRGEEEESDGMSGYLRHGLISHQTTSQFSREVLDMIETQLYAVLQHFESRNIYFHKLTLEFAVEDTQVMLLTGQRIQLLSEEVIHRIKTITNTSTNNILQAKTTKAKPGQRRRKGAEKSRGPDPLPHRHDQYRVCRHCRAPVEVELSRELMRNQIALRGVVAKYQCATEQLHQAEQQHAERLTDLIMERSKRADLERRVDELETVGQERERVLKKLRQKCTHLETELAETKEDVIKSRILVKEAQVREQTAIAREQTAIARERVLVEEAQGVVPLETHALETRVAIAEAEREQLQTQLQTLETTHHLLQCTTEDLRAEWDEMRFQWHYVRRKLVDTKQSGVFPPKRVAGGFSNYPIPSQENVESVVKWMVDYEAKRMIVEAQKSHQKAGQRLKFKVDLMRVLGVGKKTKRRLPI